MHPPLLLLVGLATAAGCTSPVDSTPAQFSANDAQTTARWASQLTAELNAVPQSSNEIARNAQIQTKLNSARTVAAKIVGERVSWSTKCRVSENVVTLMPNLFGRDGAGIITDSERNRVAMMVLDDRPKETERGIATRSADPASWFFQLDVPGQIDPSTAAALPESVIFSGEITNVEVDRFRDRELDPALQSEDNEWYLLYIYLSDVTLAPESP